MSVQDFKPALLFLLIGNLVRIKLLDDLRRVEVVVRYRRILEHDRDPIIPSAIFRRAVARLVRVNLQDATQLKIMKLASLALRAGPRIPFEGQ